MTARLTLTFYRDKAGKHRWRQRAGNHDIVSESGQGYGRRGHALHGAALAIGFDERDVAYDPKARALHADLVLADGRRLRVRSK